MARKKSPNDARLLIRLPSKMKDELVELSEHPEVDSSTSKLIRDLVRKYLNQKRHLIKSTPSQEED